MIVNLVNHSTMITFHAYFYFILFLVCLSFPLRLIGFNALFFFFIIVKEFIISFTLLHVFYKVSNDRKYDRKAFICVATIVILFSNIIIKVLIN